MPYFVNIDQRTLAQPQDIEPSARLSLAGALGSAVTGNFSSVLADYGELQQANQGPRLSKERADQAFAAAGVKHSSPADGYTQAAVDILIKRKSDDALRKRVDEATPWSWLGSPVRGSAMLLAGVADPLNLASAFIPVVREARVVSMLARAGESAGSLALTRGAIGAAEGLVGAAVLEAPTYALRTAMQDDYTLTDSLLNMAFGTVAGGGLHAVGGAIGDALRGGGNPYARFAGLSTAEVRQVLRFEGGKLASADGFTPAQRRAAGIEPQRVDVPVAAAEANVLREPPRSELASVADAPFSRLYEVTPESATRRALESMRDDLRAELLAQAGGRAEPGAIAGLRREQVSVAERRQLLESDAEFKRRAKEQQGRGLSRKEAESAARKQIAAELADVQAGEQRIGQMMEANAKASRAEQDIAALDRGEAPAQFADRVQAEAQTYIGAGEIARAITGTSEPPAAFVIGMVAPETREAAMRAALAHMSSGRLPDVDAIIRADPSAIGDRTTPQDVARSAGRQQHADSAYLGDPVSADAAAARVKEAPKQAGEQGATDELAAAMEQLTKLQKNLEASGIAPETVARLGDLGEFDAAVKRAEALGRAIEAGALCGVRQ
jgi:hypothetical protein